MTWTQNYDPLDSLWLSTALAAVPVILLMALLATGRAVAPPAALAGLAAALLLAMFLYVPRQEDGSYVQLQAWLPTMLAAAGNGAAFGLFPIGWIVLAAIFLYTLTVETGQFEIVKHSVASLSDDRRIQALLIAFCFGAFVEGAAGFGTPVAISAALLIGAGFRPLLRRRAGAAGQHLAGRLRRLGTPILTLANVTGPATTLKLSADGGPAIAVLLAARAGLAGLGRWPAGAASLGVWPALLVCGGSFAAGAVPRRQLPRPLAGRCRRRPGLAGLPDPVPASLAAAARPGTFPTSRRRPRRPGGRTLHPRPGRLRLGAVGAADDRSSSSGACRR